MKRQWPDPKIIVLMVFALLSLHASAVAQQKAFTAAAQWMVGHSSVCDVTQEPWPELGIAEGQTTSISLVPCSDTDFPAAELDVLMLRIANPADTAATLDIPMLSQVSVNAAGRSVHPVAVFIRLRGLGSGSYLKADLWMRIPIAAQGSQSVIYLVPKMSGSKRVSVVGFGPLGMSAPTPGADALTVEGVWAVGYSSVCDLIFEAWEELAVPPGEVIDFVACSDAEFPAAQLDVLILQATNRTDEAVPFQIPTLSDVVVRTEGGSVNPVAVFVRVQGLGDGSYLKRDLRMRIPVPARDEALVAYLVPILPNPKIVTVAGRGRVTVRPH